VEEQTAALTYVRDGRFHCALWGAITELGLGLEIKKMRKQFIQLEQDISE
jgi:hypothetical protein